MRQIVGVVLVKTKYWQNFDFKAKIIIIFTFSITTNFKTDIHLNNFQEHLFELLSQVQHQNGQPEKVTNRIFMIFVCYVLLSFRQVDPGSCFLSATYCCHFVKLMLHHAFCLLHNTVVTSSNWSCVTLFVCYVLLSLRQVDLASCFLSSTYCCYFVKLISRHACCLLRTVVISSS